MVVWFVFLNSPLFYFSTTAKTKQNLFCSITNDAPSLPIYFSQRVIQEEQEKVKLARKEAAAAALAAAEEAERKRLEDIQRMSQMELYIHSETIDKPVGPIALTGNSTIGSLREKISGKRERNLELRLTWCVFVTVYLIFLDFAVLQSG